MEYKSDWTYDLEVSEEAEYRTGGFLSSGNRLEIKKDRLASQTGNLFIEYESRGKPSGIATTQSSHYCFHIGDDVMLVIPTERLKDKIRPLYRTELDKRGGDNNTSKGILLPLLDLFKEAQ